MPLFSKKKQLAISTSFKAPVRLMALASEAWNAKPSRRAVTEADAEMVVNDRVVAENSSRLELLLDEHESDAQVVEELFLSSIARSPTSAEKDVALTAMARDRKKGGEDLQWALLNLSEFLYNF